MSPATTRDELIRAGLEIVRESGIQTVLPEFTIRELIDRANGPTRSAFQHAWPQRIDFERTVLEEVLADRALSAPASVTSIPRALDLMESGPDIDQFARSAYLNVGGVPQRRDLRDRVAITCIAAGRSHLASFAAQSEAARHAKADDLLVQVFRIAGMAFSIEPASRFTFLDIARSVGALNDGMLLHRIARPDAKFTDYVFRDIPGWSLESIAASAFVRFMTEPIAETYTVPLPRKPHPPEASRPASAGPKPERPPTTRSMLVDAGIRIVEERGLSCALPTFTVPDLLSRVSSDVTEGAFHHSWPRKVDFEHEIMQRLVTPDTARHEAAAADLAKVPELSSYSRMQLFHRAASEAIAREFDPSFIYLSTLIEAGNASPPLVCATADNFAVRSERVVESFGHLGQLFGFEPVDGLSWEQLAWIGMALTDGMLLRMICDGDANQPTLPQADPLITPSVLGFAFEAVFAILVRRSPSG